jgi:dTDP-4-amino-4,6-dideoxygalactose transaminase
LVSSEAPGPLRSNAWGVQYRVPFNRPQIVGSELDYIRAAVEGGHLSGNGRFAQQCQRWLEEQVGCHLALLTPSCTAALEMAALLLDLAPGDEVIMPSYTFVSTANAFVLRGAVPVFVDIRPDTLNLDEALVEAAVTPRTRAIVAVHYAGVGCDMEVLAAVAQRHGLSLVEDAAQGLQSTWRGRPLGSIGRLAALSFHETKNVIAGEGGALLVNDAELAERARIIHEKGTNRSQFFRGMVDKYTWVDVGSSFLPSELIAAFLYGQLEHAENITADRLAVWSRYHAGFAGAEAAGLLRRPVIPADCRHNAHMYYLLFPDLARRTAFIAGLSEAGILAVFHYVPLHLSPAGQRYARAAGDLPVTVRVGETLVRLPMFGGMRPKQISDVLEAADRLLGRVQRA